ncbi:hypothetical protein C2S51_018607 [Perilla frutescens var. frutescens]|nr:hypothetical protein C2S51_018607 [Perilla frutescens var. frutescens]
MCQGCGGLAPTKSSCIKSLLSFLLEKKGNLCMEYLRELSVEEVFSLLKGIGPKAVSSSRKALPFHKVIQFSCNYLIGKFYATYFEWVLEGIHGDPSVDELKVSCVLMFNLQHDDFPVDTHVFQIAKRMGWVPAVADVKTTYLHLNLPPELKFDLNCLLYTYGKLRGRCSNRKVGGKNKEAKNEDCPLLAYSELCKLENEIQT